MYKVAFRLILPRLGLLRSDLKPRVRCVYIMSESPVIHSFSLLRKNRTGLVCSRRSNLLRLAGEGGRSVKPAVAYYLRPG